LDLHLPGAACGTSTGLERAGLVVLGASYAWAGLRRDADGVALVHAVMGKDEAEESGQMARLLSSDPTDDVSIRLHLDVDAAGHVTLGASEPQRPHAAAGWSDAEAGQNHAGDGQNADETPSTYTALLTDWPATKGHWIGAEVGLFATGESLAPPSLHDRHASFGPVTVRCDGQGSGCHKEARAPLSPRWPMLPAIPVPRSPGYSTGARQWTRRSGRGYEKWLSACTIGPTSQPGIFPPAVLSPSPSSCPTSAIRCSRRSCAAFPGQPRQRDTACWWLKRH